MHKKRGGVKVKEEWRDVVPGKYQVSNTGRVKSLARWGQSINRERVWLCEMEMTPSNVLGYRTVTLDGKPQRVHRLVAMAFIPNPEGKPFVNHIDGNKANNDVRNLEWCTHQENVDHAIRTGLVKHGRPVAQYDTKLNHIRTYASLREARDAMGFRVAIRPKPVGGYYWEYADVPLEGPFWDKVRRNGE